ncbi:hypothetical protein Y032_0004g1828 [Ancylostoma ceylanicum]|uniref:Uncharacterized protein n=1 Tax=Ancylostoma ceylanicum TaxID=53326 RepID=A0A016VTF5_9BILA|nr:hypothetical protein Y032_0004g1828 [Ancylostoma ceylanicum]
MNLQHNIPNCYDLSFASSPRENFCEVSIRTHGECASSAHDVGHVRRVRGNVNLPENGIHTFPVSLATSLHHRSIPFTNAFALFLREIDFPGLFCSFMFSCAVFSFIDFCSSCILHA